MPLTSFPDLLKPATLAYTNASSNSQKLVFSGPSSNQTVDPVLYPVIKFSLPTTAIACQFNLATSYSGPVTYPNGQTSAGSSNMWLVEFLPNSLIFGTYTAAQQLTFSVSNAFGGGTGTVTWDGGAPVFTNNYNVFQFYTLDGINVKGRALVQN